MIGETFASKHCEADPRMPRKDANLVYEGPLARAGVCGHVVIM